MNFKEIFEQAFSGVTPLSGDHSIMRKFRERAYKMEKEKKKSGGIIREEQKQLVEITVPKTPERTRGRKAPFIIGAAAAVAAASGLGFWAGTGARPQTHSPAAASGTYIYEPEADTEKVDISELAGKTFGFSDLTVNITAAAYDGQYIRIDYTGTSADPKKRNYFFFEPLALVKNYYSDPAVIFSHGEVGENTSSFTIIKSFSESMFQPYSFVPICVKSNEKGTAAVDSERISDLVFTVTKTTYGEVRQPIATDKQEIADDVFVPGLTVSPIMLTIHPSGNTKEGYERICLDPELPVYAVQQDGTRIKLIGQYMFINGGGSTDGSDYSWSSEYKYIISGSTDISLLDMKGFEIDGKFIELSEKPAAVTTTLDEYGEPVEVANTAMTTVTDSTYIPTDISEISGTITTAELPDSSEDTTGTDMKTVHRPTEIESSPLYTSADTWFTYDGYKLHITGYIFDTVYLKLKYEVTYEGDYFSEDSPVWLVPENGIYFGGDMCRRINADNSFTMIYTSEVFLKAPAESVRVALPDRDIISSDKEFVSDDPSGYEDFIFTAVYRDDVPRMQEDIDSRLTLGDDSLHLSKLVVTPYSIGIICDETAYEEFTDVSGRKEMRVDDRYMELAGETEIRVYLDGVGVITADRSEVSMPMTEKTWLCGKFDEPIDIDIIREVRAGGVAVYSK